MKLVKQTKPYNCGSACLAMVLFRSVKYIEEKILKRNVGELLDPENNRVIGVTAFEMETALWDCYRTTLAICVPNSKDNSNWYNRVGHRLPILNPLYRINKHLVEDGTTILGVDSLNVENGLHWIVVHKTKIYDPTIDGILYEGDIYKPSHILKISEAILLR